MAESLLAPLGDAVVTLLNASTFSTPFTATRLYDAMRPLETLEQLRVDVVLGNRPCSPFDRSRQKNEPKIQIVARQKVAAPAGSPAETAILDTLLGLMESIDELFSSPGNRTLPPGEEGWAKWQQSEVTVPYLPAALREDHIFYSLLTLQYLVITNAT
jgi:hypothetical protein